MADIKFNRLGQCSVMRVNVVITKEFRVRLWIALKLIALATFVLGCGLEVTKIEKTAEPHPFKQRENSKIFETEYFYCETCDLHKANPIHIAENI